MTHLCFGVWKNDVVELVMIKRKNLSCLIGQVVKNQVVINPKRHCLTFTDLLGANAVCSKLNLELVKE